MAHVITCDVCEEQFTLAEWKKNPGISAKIPARLLGDTDVPPGEYTFCSWECVATLASAFTSDGDDQSDDQDVKSEEEFDRQWEEAASEPETGKVQLRLKAREDGYAPEQPTLVDVPYGGVRRRM